MDPRKEGRCFRCLARDHLARECRDPIKCHLCRQGGHRQAFCPLQQHSRTQPINTGLLACLVGETRETDPQWAQVLGGIQTLCPNLSIPDCHRFNSGDIFLRGLSKEDWRRIHGKTQKIPGGGTITWRRPRPTDGVTPPPPPPPTEDKKKLGGTWDTPRISQVASLEEIHTTNRRPP